MSIVAHQTIIVSDPPKPSELYKLGWNAYCNGFPAYDKLETKDERRGWQAANRAEAEAATPGYAESMWW